MPLTNLPSRKRMPQQLTPLAESNALALWHFRFLVVFTAGVVAGVVATLVLVAK